MIYLTIAYSCIFLSEEILNLPVMVVSVDEIYVEIGELGRQQRIYTAYLCLMAGYQAFYLFQVSAAFEK